MRAISRAIRAIGLSLLLLLPLLPTGSAAARCLGYEPAVVTLEGELISQVLPGPPRYKSLARGDLPETVYTLRLVSPICVKGDPDSSLNTRTHGGVDAVQLDLTASRARAYVGKRVRVTGSLFGAQSDAHRTPVVLRVSGLREQSD